jgi:(1->4)-alpha-D-glucan 1-alpha-D-glucosylmutase
VVRYYDHVFPLAPGSDTAAPVGELLEAQHYRLASWTIADDELNYRRFFDVTSLIAVRVEEPDVFDATHQLLVDGIRSGAIDGLRIDHPDGLADPQGYL